MVLSALLIISSAVRPAIAEEKIKLEEVVVSATRVTEPVEETTSNVIVITAKDISRMNVEFVPDVLRKIPDLQLVQNGGVGRQATVFLRGGSPSQTLVMIDGTKMNSPNVGSFDFSGISVDDIERIEIVKGPQSTIYGSEAMAGVINIITKKGEGKTKAEISFEGGSFGTYKPAVTVSGSADKFNYRVTGSYFSTTGISVAKGGTELDGYNNAAVSGKFGFKPSEIFDIEITGKSYYDHADLDDFDFFNRTAVDNPNFVQTGNHMLLSAKARLLLFSKWEQVLTLSTIEDILRFRDPVVAFNNADIKSSVDTVDWQHNVYLSDFYNITAGFEYKKERGVNEGNFDKTSDDKAFYLNNRLKLFSESLVLNAGLRHDDYNTFGSKTTYRVGAVYNMKTASLRIKGSYGTGFRAPSFNELFFPFYGNTNLKPEETTSWELGVEKDLLKDRAVASVTYFEQRYTDLIDTDPATFTAANISKAEVKGVEISTSCKVTDAINVKAGYTHLDPKNKDTGERLPLRPEDKVIISADFATGPFSLTANYTFTGERSDSSSLRTLSSYSLVNLSGNYLITKWLTAFARVDNLFNAHYEEVGGFNTPGFSVFGGVKIKTL